MSEPFLANINFATSRDFFTASYLSGSVPNLFFGSDCLAGNYETVLNGREYVSHDGTRAAYWLRFAAGRDCGCSLAGGSVGISSLTSDYTPNDDYTGLSLLSDHIRLRDAGAQDQYLVMFAPLVDGTLEESGVYLRSFRPPQNKSSGWWLSYNRRMLPVSYSRTVLPIPMAVCEVGLMSSGSFTPIARKLAWDASLSDSYYGTSYLNGAFYYSPSPENYPYDYGTAYPGTFSVRAGLTDGNMFVADFGLSFPFVGSTSNYLRDAVGGYSELSAYTASANSSSDLSFAFTPASQDHAVLLSRYWESVYYGSTGWDFGALAPRLASRLADHAAVERCSFLARLVAWSLPPYSSPAGSDYWKSFPYSRSPSELHRDSPSMPPSAMQDKTTGPCPLVRSSNDGNYVSPYPVGETQTQASCIAAHSNFTSTLPISDSSNFIDVSPSDGSLVLAGKKVTSIELTFTPYIAPIDQDTPRTLPSGLASPVRPSSASWGSFYGDAASSGWSSGYWWVKSGTVSAPASPSVYPGYPSVVYNGRIWSPSAWGTTLSTTDYAALGPLTRAEHDNIIFHEHLRLTKTIHGQSGSTDASTLGDDGYLGVAPLLGTYSLTRFSIGSIPAAGNVFRFAGAGSWYLDRSVGYDFKLESATVSQAYITSGGYCYPQSTLADQTPSTVSVTEDWSLSTAHVEMYAAVLTGLQEYGEISTDVSRPDGDEVRSPDQPKGRTSSSFVIHEPGTPPRPTVTLSLAARTVMRGDLTMTVTAPGEMSFPYTFSNKTSTVGSMCRGSGYNTNSAAYVDASGPNGLQSQTTHLDHTQSHFQPMTFSGSQTARLLAGETVTATWWTAQRDGTEGRPVIIQLGDDYAQKLPRMYSVSLKLNLADL